jgi:hypothetical protein
MVRRISLKIKLSSNFLACVARKLHFTGWAQERQGTSPRQKRVCTERDQNRLRRRRQWEA